MIDRIIEQMDVEGDDPVTKLNEVIVQVNNLTRAVETLCYWLVQAQTGFSHRDAEGVVDIVRGRKPA